MPVYLDPYALAPLTYADLPATDRHRREVARAGGGTIHIEGPPIVLYCPDCAAEYSASRADYWSVPSHETVLCADCGAPMTLAQKRTTVHALSPEQARAIVQYGGPGQAES